MYLSDGRYNSSSAEAGVLVAITSHGRGLALTPSEGNPQPLLYPPRKRDPAYLSGGFLSMSRNAPQRDTSTPHNQTTNCNPHE
ncbi:hypothetical protein AVEN_157201-1 [Araneus ventricosus]|uniref:Uncharacterized protein n=1 Tax=Araneus ventricosus TaxID=182803 RepID=A0A4Y2EGX8_ARAVE|nr:hypothetical protein AVEN_157201-1 [Araneus ventricosus]